jgi:pimeloyl-ACP methyl ester carboxylesterase
MIFRDDELKELEAHGLPALPPADVCGHVTNDGARLWFQAFGAGAPVVLLHGGLGHGGNWAHQVPALVAAGWRPIVIDSRGHGRSTMGPHPLSYSLMASDLLAVMDHLTLKRAPIVGWSDGADTGLIAARDTPQRISGLFFFACNVDGSGTKPFVMTPVIERILATHKRNYSELSPEPSEFERLMQTTETMQRSQPNLSADDIRGITVPVTVAIGEDDEFITRDHMVYLADTLPHGTLRILDGVTHFAPLQRPDLFNRAVLEFLDRQTPAAYF